MNTKEKTEIIVRTATALHGKGLRYLHETDQIDRLESFRTSAIDEAFLIFEAVEERVKDQEERK